MLIYLIDRPKANLSAAEWMVVPPTAKAIPDFVTTSTRIPRDCLSVPTSWLAQTPYTSIAFFFRCRSSGSADKSLPVTFFTNFRAMYRLPWL